MRPIEYPVNYSTIAVIPCCSHVAMKALLPLEIGDLVVLRLAHRIEMRPLDIQVGLDFSGAEPSLSFPRIDVPTSRFRMGLCRRW